jgi:hypothetical protein
MVSKTRLNITFICTLPLLLRFTYKRSTATCGLSNTDALYLKFSYGMFYNFLNGTTNIKMSSGVCLCFHYSFTDKNESTVNNPVLLKINSETELPETLFASLPISKLNPTKNYKKDDSNVRN